MTIAARPPADGLLHSAAWRAAFAAVPRETFLSAGVQGRGGAAGGLPPATAAVMCEALDVPGEARVLEVGTGTGYGAALLSHRFGSARVVSLDADPERLAAARTRLAHAGYAPELLVGEAAHGCPERAPFGGLLAGRGAGRRVPAAWPGQVVPGGTVVAALGTGTAVLRTGEDGGAAGRFLPVLAPAADAVEPAVRAYIPALLVPLGTRADVPLTADPTADMPRFLGGLAQPDVSELCLIDADGRPVLGLVHPGTGSWARVAPRDDGTARLQYDGPRNLWAERAPLIEAWGDAGRPGPEGYGLTVTASGVNRLWLGSQEGPVLTL
ncbi:methyltransferase domain-containing protein [Streptomyces sp. MP131-18]|uniref:methyltransferase domain-containing protein n=1 Tax=Streptomyces sp. MP131-18 TaxID=1857892 RepID=UPI00097BDED2|nr:methyltransferase domain-containing protein [Streptomyces sp. MP131-18]ONK11371.1 Protein-L-isoaspartate O-methyltransferase [Streptomyces sp. MP131-18]